MATSTQKPVHVFRCGGISASIWQNVGAYGLYFTVTFSRPVKDQAGEWHNFRGIHSAGSRCHRISQCAG